MEFSTHNSEPATMDHFQTAFDKVKININKDETCFISNSAALDSHCTVGKIIH